MNTITWLGEGDSPSSIVWNGIIFVRGDAVAVDDPWMLAKAQGNPYFAVRAIEEAPAASPPLELLPEMPPAPDLAEQLQVVKRKRGRPRKVTANADQ